MTISPFKVIQGHRFWFQSKAHTRLPITTIAIAICMQLNAQYLPIGKYCAFSISTLQLSLYNIYTVGVARSLCRRLLLDLVN